MLLNHCLFATLMLANKRHHFNLYKIKILTIVYEFDALEKLKNEQYLVSLQAALCDAYALQLATYVQYVELFKENNTYSSWVVVTFKKMRECMGEGRI